ALRVCLHGNIYWQVDLRARPGGIFRVPFGVPSLEIFGDDEEGALLLAVFLLPEPEALANGQAHHLWVALEGGQTLALQITVDKRAGRRGRAYAIHLAYTVALPELHADTAQSSMTAESRPFGGLRGEDLAVLNCQEARLSRIRSSRRLAEEDDF